MKSIKIAQGVTIGDWQELDLSGEEYGADWETAIQIFEKRIRNRFFKPVKVLLDSENNLKPQDKQHGFSIMGILCLIVESLQCFAEGKAHSKGISKEVFVRFLSDNEPFRTKLKCTPEIAEQIFYHFRCGILHQAEITGGARLRSIGPAVRLKNGKLILNRTKFANGIFQYFETYLKDLRKEDDKGKRLRKNLKMKFETIIQNAI